MIKVHIMLFNIPFQLRNKDIQADVYLPFQLSEALIRLLRLIPVLKNSHKWGKIIDCAFVWKLKHIRALLVLTVLFKTRIVTVKFI